MGVVRGTSTGRPSPHPLPRERGKTASLARERDHGAGGSWDIDRKTLTPTLSHGERGEDGGSARERDHGGGGAGRRPGPSPQPLYVRPWTVFEDGPGQTDRLGPETVGERGRQPLAQSPNSCRGRHDEPVSARWGVPSACGGYRNGCPSGQCSGLMWRRPRDVAVWPTGEDWTRARSPAPATVAARTAAERIVLEATGGYERAGGRRAGRPAVAWSIREDFAPSRHPGQDRSLDAGVLARFAADVRPPVRPQPSKAVQHLRALVREAGWSEPATQAPAPTPTGRRGRPGPAAFELRSWTGRWRPPCRDPQLRPAPPACGASPDAPSATLLASARTRCSRQQVASLVGVPFNREAAPGAGGTLGRARPGPRCVQCRPADAPLAADLLPAPRRRSPRWPWSPHAQALSFSPLPNADQIRVT